MLQYEEMIIQDHLYLEVHKHAIKTPILESERRALRVLDFKFLTFRQLWLKVSQNEYSRGFQNAACLVVWRPVQE